MTLRIDARGMRCPWPAIRLASALRGPAPQIEMLADDPAAPGELALVAKAAGARISAKTDFLFFIERDPPA